MKRWVKDWDKLRPYERVFHMLTNFFSIVTIILAVISLFEVVHYWTALLSLACVQFCQAVYTWRSQREIGIMGLGAGTVVLAVIVAMLFA